MSAGAFLCGQHTIYVVEGDQPLREALRDLLEENGWAVELFVDEKTFMAAFNPTFMGCVLVDGLPGTGGPRLLKWLQARNHRLPTVMMTGYGDVAAAVEAMKAGAVDFIEKPIHHDDLIAVVERASNNSQPGTTRNEVAARGLAGLTSRERQVLEMIVDGQTNRMIAATLGIHQGTVAKHRAAIMRKTGSRSIVALVRLALLGGG